MEKELETANEIVRAESSGGFNNFKETIYNVLGNFFGWFSTHQGLALIIILVVLGIIIWLILSARKYRKQIEKNVASKNKEIGKKDALIEWKIKIRKKIKKKNQIVVKRNVF